MLGQGQFSRQAPIEWQSRRCRVRADPEGDEMRLSMIVALADYPLGPDSERHAGVPSGTVSKHSWTSRIFPGTQRDYWVYVPAQYRAETPAALMVFQDGKGYVAEEGRWRVPVVFDNLIAKGEMPVT